LPDADVALALAFANRSHTLHRRRIQREQQLLAITRIGCRIRIRGVACLRPLPHLPQFAPHTVTHAPHDLRHIRISTFWLRRNAFSSSIASGSPSMGIVKTRTCIVST